MSSREFIRGGARPRPALLLLIVAALGVQIQCSRGDGGSERAPLPQDAALATARLPHLDPGDVVPGFEAESVGGGRVRIEYPEGGGRTFLFVLSPTCGVCMATLPSWNRIAASVEEPDRVYGFSVDTGNSYHFQAEQKLEEEGKLLFPLLRFVEQGTRARYRIANVPHTLVIGPAGRVEKALVGELSDALVDSILSPTKPTLAELP